MFFLVVTRDHFSVLRSTLVGGQGGEVGRDVCGVSKDSCQTKSKA